MTRKKNKRKYEERETNFEIWTNQQL